MKSLKTATCLFLVAATASPAAAQVGSVLRFRHIGPGDGGFVGPLDRDD